MFKNKIRVIAIAAALTASAGVHAGFVYTDLSGTAPITVPNDNDFRTLLSGQGVSSFDLGRVLGLEDVNAGDLIDIDFFAAEAGYRNTFSWGSSLIINNLGNRSWTERDVGTVGAYDGSLNFKFCAVNVSSCLTNGGNNSTHWNSYQSIGMRISDDGNTAWLLWDDSGANMDDDHDDLIVRLTYRSVPEPGTLALLGLGLLGTAFARRRKVAAN